MVLTKRCPAGMLMSGLALLLDALLPAEHDKRAARAAEKVGVDLRRHEPGVRPDGQRRRERLLHEVPGALPARAASGTRWTRRQIHRLFSDSVFKRMVRDARHRIFEVSHTERTLKGFERRVLPACVPGAGCRVATPGNSDAAPPLR